MRPVIVGAGPVGLSAALFLAQHGIRARVLEASESRSPYSRALAVNPRSLSLLESTGVTAELLKHGQQVHSAHITMSGQTLMRTQLGSLKTRYPFMLALSQATTENILVKALRKFGIEVEYGAALVGCRQRFGSVETRIKHKHRDGVEDYDSPWLFAADGAKSSLRNMLKVRFNGSTFRESWSLVDVPLRTPRALDEAHIDFIPGGGFLFLMPIFSTEDLYNTSTQVWRVLGNVTNPLDHLHGDDDPAGAPVWKSDFRISHRFASRMSVGCVHFAGDAAHVHSPMGARGMNLGIEDAWVFAKAAAEGRIETYAKLREPVDRAVVKRVELFTRIVQGRSVMTRFMREHVLTSLVKIPHLADVIKAAVTGLDHEMPLIEAHHTESFAIPSPL